MAYDRAYGAAHKARRAELLAVMEQGQPCPICGAAMFHGQPIDLHHSDPDSKKWGLPGDALAHAICNRGEKSVPPQVRAAAAAKREVSEADRRLRGLGLVPLAAQCEHTDPWAERHTPGTFPPCPHCGGSRNSRIWPDPEAGPVPVAP